MTDYIVISDEENLIPDAVTPPRTVTKCYVRVKPPVLTSSILEPQNQNQVLFGTVSKAIHTPDQHHTSILQINASVPGFTSMLPRTYNFASTNKDVKTNTPRTSHSTSLMFPLWSLAHEPHAAQVNIMNCLRSTFQKKRSALIESPTGTGKTVALLCAALERHKELQSKTKLEIDALFSETAKAEKNQRLPTLPYLGRSMSRPGKRGRDQQTKISFAEFCQEDNYVDMQQERSDYVPTIFYCTRTHSQVSHVVSELRKLNIEGVHMNVLGGRERYCINPRVKTGQPNIGNNLGEMCDKAVVQGQCDAWEKLDDFKQRVGSVPHVWDIEDLVEAGKAHGGCPYYCSRELVYSAHITVCPYNYILDPFIRHESKIEGRIKNAIIIIDEAHNAEDVCRSVLEVDVMVEEMDRAVEALMPFMDGAPLHYDRAFHTGRFQFPEVCGMAVRVLNAIKSFITDSENVSVGNHSGGKILEALSSTVLSTPAANSKKPQQQPPLHRLFVLCLRMFLSLGVTFNPFSAEVASIHIIKKILSFVFFLHAKPAAFTVSVTQNRERFLVYCADAQLAFRLLAQDAASVVIASGTLPSKELLQRELGVLFEDEIRCDHVVNVEENVKGLIVRGIGKATYNTMYTETFASRLGDVVVNLVSTCPKGGCLLFVPNYTALNSWCEHWKRQGDVFSKLSSLGVQVFAEPKGGSSQRFEDTLHAFKTRCNKTRQTTNLFIAVFRGKVSEGLDFSDDMARMVICVGVPFRSVMDERVIAKKAYNDARDGSGDAWLLQDAVVAVNQALGRCIRHPKDYGALVLVDERWCQPDMKDLLSKWFRPCLRAFVLDDTDTESCRRGLKAFFSKKSA